MNIKLIMLMESLRAFVKREDGASAIEYALIAGLMAALVVTAFTLLGGDDGGLSGIFKSINTALKGAASEVTPPTGG